MFANLSEFLSKDSSLEVDKDGNPTNRELQVAVVALLLEMANSDAKFSAEELGRVMTVMFSEMELKEYDTAEIIEMVEFLKRDGSKLNRFIDALNEHFSNAQRQMVLALIWRVVNADGKIDNFETALAVELRKRLNLSLEQAAFARQIAEKMNIAVPARGEDDA